MKTKTIIILTLFTSLFLFTTKLFSIAHTNHTAESYFNKLSNEINFNEIKKNNPEFDFIESNERKILILEFENSYNPFKANNLVIIVDGNMHILIYDSSRKKWHRKAKDLLSLFYTKKCNERHKNLSIEFLMSLGGYTKIRDSKVNQPSENSFTNK